MAKRTSSDCWYYFEEHDTQLGISWLCVPYKTEVSRMQTIRRLAKHAVVVREREPSRLRVVLLNVNKRTGQLSWPHIDRETYRYYP